MFRNTRIATMLLGIIAVFFTFQLLVGGMGFVALRQTNQDVGQLYRLSSQQVLSLIHIYVAHAHHRHAGQQHLLDRGAMVLEVVVQPGAVEARVERDVYKRQDSICLGRAAACAA